MAVPRSPFRLALPLVGFLLAAGAAAAGAAELRLERVLLSSAGMALLDHVAEVGPRAEVELVVPRAQADDILKSLVVHDPGGIAHAVTLVGEAPTADLFRDLPLAERELATPQALLAALRGVPVSIGGPKAVEGRILALVPEEHVEGEARILRHRLTLATADGLRSLLLEEADPIRIADPALSAVLGTALERLARARAPAERRLLVRLEGSGPREVRVAWLAETPVWKMSYRAILGAREARLQGWAVVDNRTGRDWEGVELTLVAGAPVTLRQALSRLVWAERPEVPVRLPEPVRPRVDEGPLPPAPSPAGAPSPSRARAALAPAPASTARDLPEAMAAAPPETPAEVARAEAAESPIRTVFRLPAPVSLPERGTALLPVLDRALPAERIALLQADRTPSRPLAALRLLNEGPAALPPGILTIFAAAEEGGGFLGDAELALLSPGDSRLVPYALDRGLRVETLPEASGRVVAVRAADGVLLVDRVERRAVRYRLETLPGEARTLVLEHPREPGFRLVEPSAVAESERFWRIERRLEAGARLELPVVVERPERRELALVDLDPAELRLLFAGTSLPPALERAMAEIARIRARVGEAAARADRLERERGELEAEQARLRANLAAVPAGSDLARRYLARLGASEDRLEALAAELDGARAAAAAAEEELRRFVRTLDL